MKELSGEFIALEGLLPTSGLIPHGSSRWLLIRSSSVMSFDAFGIGGGFWGIRGVMMQLGAHEATESWWLEGVSGGLLLLLLGRMDLGLKEVEGSDRGGIGVLMMDLSYLDWRLFVEVIIRSAL